MRGQQIRWPFTTPHKERETIVKKPITYFVSFHFLASTTSGFGNTEVTVDKGITSLEDIRKVEALISVQWEHRDAHIVINNYIRLSK